MPLGWGSKDKPAPPDTGLLDAFDRALQPDVASTGPASGWTDKDTRSLLGRDLPLFTLFMAERARLSVGNGALRFLMPDTEPSLIGWNGREGWRSDWPSVESATAFASDWRGGIYLLAKGKQIRDGEPPVVLLDPAVAEVVVLDYTFGEFLGDAIAADWRNLLEADRLDEQRTAGGQTPSPDQCVSPKIPLLLGGSTEIPDLEIGSLVVAVSLAGQMWEQVKNLPPGTPISGVSLRQPLLAEVGGEEFLVRQERLVIRGWRARREAAARYRCSAAVRRVDRDSCVREASTMGRFAEQPPRGRSMVAYVSGDAILAMPLHLSGADDNPSPPMGRLVAGWRVIHDTCRV